VSDRSPPVDSVRPASPAAEGAGGHTSTAGFVLLGMATVAFVGSFVLFNVMQATMFIGPGAMRVIALVYLVVGLSMVLERDGRRRLWRTPSGVAQPPEPAA